MSGDHYSDARRFKKIYLKNEEKNEYTVTKTKAIDLKIKIL